MSDALNGYASTKADRLAQEFRRRIISGEFSRDTWLRQDELANEFGVSITPVREALRLLSSEGLVAVEPNRGVRVLGANLDRILAAYVVRRLTESFATRRAVYRLSALDFDNLGRILAASANDAEAVRARNREFHFYFYDRCGLPELTAMISQMWDAFPWDLLLGADGRPSESAREHRLILDAAIVGDADTAAALLEAHLATGLLAIEKHLGTPDPISDPFDDR
jgi:DNA-binding GntR family transcriptional regulator